MPRSMRDLMWAEALVVLARNHRSQHEVFRPTMGGWEPPVDVLETETELVVVVGLPGVRRDDIEIMLGDGEVLVRGTRRWRALQQPARVHRVELPHGHFERRLGLPPGTYQLVSEEYADGCLVITLRRFG